MSDSGKEGIIELLRQKIELKQLVFNETKNVFNALRVILADLSKELSSKVKNINSELTVFYKENGEFEIEFTLADETILFVMHSNIFTFDSTHEIWKSSYVKENKERAYCGKIFIYNFLADSFKYNRANDIGYLIGRVFVNKENHFFVEGKKQLGNLYSDFSTSQLDNQMLQKIVEAAVMYSLEFDPFTPPFEAQGQISVGEVLDASLQSRITTGKRLGFKFQSDGGGAF